MITFKRLCLQNIIYYKNAELDLDYVGISVIRGRNHNVIRGMIRNNGSGKSLLVSSLASLLGYGSPTANTSKRSANRDLMEDGSSISVDLQINEIDYSFTKSLKGRTLKYDISSPGKDLKPRTPTIAAEEIRNLVGLSEDEFFSLVYLDSRRPYLLQIGTASQRLAFFTSLFRLDDYDVVRSRINAALTELKDTRIRHDTLQGELEIAQASLKGLDIEVLQAETDSLSSKLSALNKELHTLQDNLTLCRIYETHAPIKDEILALETELGVADETVAASELQKTQKLRNVRIKYDQFLANQKRADAAIHKVQQEIEDLCDDLDYDVSSIDKEGLRHYIKSIHADQHEYKTLVDRYKRFKERIVDVDGVVESVAVLSAKIVAIEEDRAEIRASISALLEQKSHIETHLTQEKATCSVCDSELTPFQAKVKLEGIKRKIKSQRALIARTDAKLDECQDDLRKAKTELRNVQTRQKMGELRAYAKQLQKNFVNVHIEPLEILLDKVSELDSLKKNIPTWEGGKINSPPAQPADEYQNRIERLKLLQSLYGNHIHIRDKLVEAENLFIKYPGIDQKRLTLRINAVRNKIADIHAKLPSVKANLINHRTLNSRAEELKSTVTSLGKNLKDIEVLNLLQDAYSSKGLKMLVAQRIATMIQRNMNNYSNLLFPEPFRFKFIVNANQFDILVRRKAISKTGATTYRISDVRFLSGAESRAFTLLCLISIMPLIPKQRRVNICVLDEIEANLDESGKNLFINQFLPAFNLVVPHILVVTPGDDVYPDSRVFVATKRGNETRLLTVGHT